MAVSRRVVVGSGLAGAAALAVGGSGNAWATVENPGTPDAIATDPNATPVGGSLTIYSGRNEGLVGPLIESVEQVLGIDIEVRYGNTAELAATILEEGDNSPADVFLSQDGGSLGAVAKSGAFAALPQNTLDKVASEFRSDEGLWVGLSGRARVLAYNTDNVDAATLPASIEALTDPAWKSQIGWAPTNASFQTFVTAFRLLKGEDAAKAWLEGMIANETIVFEGNGEAVRATAAGEIQAALVNHYYRYEISAEEGEEIPVANHFFAGGDVGSLVNVAGIGILGTASNTVQAQAFVDYLLTPAAQSYFAQRTFEYPLVEGVEPFEGLLPFAKIETPEINLNDLDDLEGTLLLLTDVGLI